MTRHDRFRKIVDEIRRINARRDAAVLDAFAVLETQDPELANLLQQNVGDRVRAARWMCMQQRAFDGRSAYEALADGEADRVWDRVLGEDGPDAAARMAS